MKKLIAVLIILGIIGILGGCGPSIDTGNGSMSLDKGKMKFTDKDGNEAEVATGENGVSLPEGYPTNLVPVIDDSTIMVANKGDDNGKPTYYLLFNTTESFNDAVKYYQDAMKGATETNTLQMGTMTTLMGVKNGNTISIAVSKDDSDKTKTGVMINIAPKR